MTPRVFPNPRPLIESQAHPDKTAWSAAPVRNRGVERLSLRECFGEQAVRLRVRRRSYQPS